MTRAARSDQTNQALRSELQVLHATFGVDVAPAGELQGEALRKWIEDAEDHLESLRFKLGYMRNKPQAEREAAFTLLDAMRAKRQFPRLLGLVQEIAACGDPAQAREFDAAKWLKSWLERPQPSLGMKTPADQLGTPEGMEAVEALLKRIAVGGFA